jgi:hypothetical protein
MSNEAIDNAVKAMEAAMVPAEPNVEEVEELSEESDVVDGEESSAEEESEAEEASEDAETSEEVELKDSPQLKAIEKREKRLKDQELKIKELYKAEEDRVNELKQEVLPYLDDVKKFKELQKSINLDPISVLKSLGAKNLKVIAETIWVDLMGDKAPPEWKDKAKQLEIQRQIDHLASKADATKEEPNAGGAEFDEYVDNLSYYLSEVPEDMPYVRALVEENESEALETLYQAADALYRNNKHLGIPSPEDAAKYLEEYLDSQHTKAVERYNKLKGKSVTKTKTISSKKAKVRGSGKDSNKPLTDEERLARAVIAAENATRQ